MLFWLGSHNPSWVKQTNVPLFLSRTRLARYKILPPARGPVAIDSGAFSELSLRGKWTISPAQYASEVSEYAQQLGTVEWAAIQDYMCEPFILEKTGLTVEEHQRLTLENYVILMSYAPEIPWLPVLQGYTLSDYIRHLKMYRAAKFNDTYFGVGSVCRRQAADEIGEIFKELASYGLALHGFGVKKQGLSKYGQYLASSDSMAWSFDARRLQYPWCGSWQHQNCANCIEYALDWREQVIQP